MQIAIISRGTGWHVRDLQRAAKERNWDSCTVDFRMLAAGIVCGPHPLDGFDAIIVRTMALGSLEQVVFRMDVLHRLESQGIQILNPPRVLETCIDKFLTTARLEQAGLPVPPTVVCQNTDAALEAFERLGRDVVVKPLFGSEGRGMVRVSDPDLAWRVFRALEQAQSVLYLQQYVHHPGWDLRAFVLGDKIIAAMRRMSNGGFRTNVAQGGSTQPIRLGPREFDLALAAARAVGAVAAGVDLLPGPQGELYVLEVNAVPGWRALSRTTGMDIADAILSHLGPKATD